MDVGGAKSKAKSVADDAQALINAALLILEKFPKLPDDSDASLGIGSSFNPFKLITTLLKETAGYNAIIDIVSSFLIVGIKPLEWAVKFALITNIKNLLTCSLNPLITDDILQNGVCFSLRSIDVLNQLYISPLDEKYGKYYYWGFFEQTPKKDDSGNVIKNSDGEIEYTSLRKNIVCAEDMLKSDDMNVWLWYMKNKSMERVVWHAKNPDYTENNGEDEFLPFHSVEKATLNSELTSEDKPLWDDVKEKYEKSAKSEARAFVESEEKSTHKYKKQATELYEQELRNTHTDWTDEQIEKELKSKTSKKAIKQQTKDLMDAAISSKETELLQITINNFNNATANASNIGPQGIDATLPAIRKKTKKGKLAKMKKSDGIVTFCFYETPELVRDYIGNDSWLNVPYNDVIQVFIGNTRPETPTHNDYQGVALENEAHQIDEQIKEIEKKIDKAKSQIWDTKDAQVKGYCTAEECEQQCNNIQAAIDQANIKKSGLQADLNDINNKLAKAEAEYQETVRREGSLSYHGFTQNYYYRRTIVEFNYDYVMSMTLFEPKTLVTQLIDACVSLGQVGVTLTAEEYFVKEEVKKMVQGVIENDDTEVSDCFFTFSNQEYDQMLRNSELMRRGIYVNANGEASGTKINVDDILSTLNELSSTASPEGQTKIIKGALTQISGMVSSIPTASEGDRLNGNIELNFIENILNNLAYVITVAVISPKLYLLIALNLRLIGQDSNFRIEDFIVKFKMMIVSLIRTIRDQLLNYLINELMKLIGDIVTRLSVEFSLETVRYYKRLIKKIIKDCSFNFNGRTLDFTQDTIEHADIIASGEEPPSAEC